MVPPSLRFALRRLVRSPGSTTLHVGGLAVGLTCCILALLYIQDERSHDRFHRDAKQIVEVHTRVMFGGQELTWTELPAGGAAALRSEVAGVEALTQTQQQTGLVRATPTADGLDADIRFADASFFEVFDFPVLQGDAEALNRPGVALVTASLATLLFDAVDPVGRDIHLERTGFGMQGDERIALTVAGIVADPPAATSLGFDLVVSGSTPVAYIDTTSAALGERAPAYLRLASLADTSGIHAALTPLLAAQSSGYAAHMQFEGIATPRLVDRHLGASGSPLEGQRLFMTLFASVAGLVLLLACVNYANLATALAVGRATEIGVRKTLGAGRDQLARLFIAEAVLLSVAAGVVAIGLVAALQTPFNDVFDKDLALSSAGVAAWGLVAALVVVTGVVAGGYPAAVLARFQPVAALAGTVQGRGGARVRQALVVFQFAVTAMLLTGTAVVFDQLQRARTADLGFEGDRVVTLDLDTERLKALRTPLKKAVESVPGVAHASLASSVPGGVRITTTVSPGATPDDASDDLNVTEFAADEDFLVTTGLRLDAGAWVTPESADTDVIVNETAARALGLMTTDPSEAVGRTLTRNIGSTFRPLDVVGVVRDFHVDELREAIPPLLVTPIGESETVLTLAVQLRAADASALADVEAAWSRVAPDYAFEPVFLDDLFADRLRDDRRLGQLFGLFGIVAVVLACVGVFGLAAHAAERRSKEVGVRKVLGASVASLVARLSGEFARLVAIALGGAIPVTVVVAQRWLEGFAYPAPLRLAPFVAVALGVLALALLTAGVHALRAALADPVRALRSE